MKEPTKPCTHEWETIRVRIQPEREDDKSPQFLGIGAYFIKKKCKNCPESRSLDYVVEK